MVGPVWIPEGAKFECCLNNFFPDEQRQDLGNVSMYNCVSILLAPLNANHLELNANQEPVGYTYVPYFQAPDFTGTFSQANIYWLCGFYLYTNLPANWFGCCAQVRDTQHSYTVSAQNVRNQTLRIQRSIPDPQDPIWGSDVPQEYKLWSKGSKVTPSLRTLLAICSI